MFWLEEWCKLIQNTELGRIFIKNLLADHRHSRLNKGRFQQFFSVARAKWKQHPDGCSPLESLPKPHHMKCHGSEIKDQTCSRVMSAHDLILHNIDLKRTAFTISDTVPISYIRILEKLSLKGISKGIMEDDNSVVWVTESGALAEDIDLANSQGQQESVSRVQDRLALRVIDRLALYGFPANELLVEIQYPAHSPSILHSPTALDGIYNPFYRSSSSPNGWGHAIWYRESVIEKGEPKYKKGLPEAVHRPFQMNGDFRVRYIGRLPPFTVPRSATYDGLKPVADAHREFKPYV